MSPYRLRLLPLLMILVLGLLLASAPGTSSAQTRPYIERPEACSQGVEPCIAALRELRSQRGSIAAGIHVAFDRDDPNPVRRAILVGVIPGGPADRAGLRTGEEVVAIDGERLAPNPGRVLERLLPMLEIGDTVAFTMLRDGVEEVVEMKAIEPPEAVIRSNIYNHLAVLFGPEEARRYRASTGPFLELPPGSHDQP
ncbi:MAG: PDZ domain-containing protein [Acidobacteriota bacterium]|nr:PDZ domain-containing protein [Acidobacteriota bacterium]